MSLYLDIETDWNGGLTVVGFYHDSTGLVQLVGDRITRHRLLRALPEADRIFTYNGHCFDLHRIRDELGVDLRRRYRSCDLRWVCQGCGLTGGQKAVERQLGIKRKHRGLDGHDAMRLWTRWHHRGDEEALRLLLEYNAEDVMNLVKIRKHLERRKILVLE